MECGERWNCTFPETVAEITNYCYNATQTFVEIGLLCETIKRGLYGATVIVVQQLFKNHENTTILGEFPVQTPNLQDLLLY